MRQKCVTIASKMRGSRESFLMQEWPEYGWRTYMDQNGPLQAKNGPKRTILVHFGLTDAKIRFGIRSF